ncbi:MAG: hypothetical protein ACRCVN_01755 [Spirochaetia bacterium]
MIPLRFCRLGGIFFLLLFVFFSPYALFSQAISIGKVNFSADRTKRDAFDRSFGPLEGQSFQSQKDLDDFVENLRQRMTKSERFRSFTIGATPAGNGVVDLDVEIIDSWIGIGAAAPFYDSSTGFFMAAGAIFSNVAGDLFDLILVAIYNAEPHKNGLAWNDPMYQGSLAISRIPLGNRLYLGGAAEIVRNAKSSYDRGVEVYRDRSLQTKFTTQLTWEPTLEWTVSWETLYLAGFLPEITMNFRPDQKYGTLSRNLFSQDISVSFDGATRGRSGIPVGPQATLTIGYSFDDSFYEGRDHAFKYSTQLSYSWNVYDIFYPSLSIFSYYKTGVPHYDMANQMRGIFNGEWRGNGVTRLSADFLFYIYEIPKWLFIHMGPFIDYGVSYGQLQNFEENDQGASIGLRIRLLFPLAPSSPLYIDVGYDLRNKYRWTDLRRFEFVVGSSFSL